MQCKLPFKVAVGCLLCSNLQNFVNVTTMKDGHFYCFCSHADYAYFLAQYILIMHETLPCKNNTIWGYFVVLDQTVITISSVIIPFEDANPPFLEIESSVSNYAAVSHQKKIIFNTNAANTFRNLNCVKKGNSEPIC